MKLIIIKYNAGNVRSVQFALERLGIEPVLSDDPEVILAADKIIFPGVGEASSAMDYLKQRGLDKLILDAKQPFLGICLGMLWIDHGFGIEVAREKQGAKHNAHNQDDQTHHAANDQDDGLLLFRLFFNDFCCFWGCCCHRAPLYKQIDTGSTGRFS